MSLKKVLIIIGVETLKSKAGKDYRVAQCIVEGEAVKVGKLMVFKPELQIQPGSYDAEFEVNVNYDGFVAAELVNLKPTQAAPGTVAAALSGRKILQPASS